MHVRTCMRGCTRRARMAPRSWLERSVGAACAHQPFRPQRHGAYSRCILPGPMTCLALGRVNRCIDTRVHDTALVILCRGHPGGCGCCCLPRQTPTRVWGRIRWLHTHIHTYMHAAAPCPGALHTARKRHHRHAAAAAILFACHNHRPRTSARSRASVHCTSPHSSPMHTAATRGTLPGATPR